MLSGYSGVRGRVSAGTFVGQMQWIRGGTVGVGQVGENGEAVDATPGRVAGYWAMGSSVGGTNGFDVPSAQRILLASLARPTNRLGAGIHVRSCAVMHPNAV